MPRVSVPALLVLGLVATDAPRTFVRAACDLSCVYEEALPVTRLVVDFCSALPDC